jgi:hypothetical protein
VVGIVPDLGFFEWAHETPTFLLLGSEILSKVPMVLRCAFGAQILTNI